jgi:putative transposase
MADWPHAPVHRLDAAGAYMVTAGTYQKAHRFRGPDRLKLLQDQLLSLALQYGWQLQAWAVFSNHYHFVALSPDNRSSLRQMISHLHTTTAHELNRLDGCEGRKIWFQYWDAHLTVRAILPGSAELRAPEPGAAWSGEGRDRLSVVLCWVV